MAEKRQADIWKDNAAIARATQFNSAIGGHHFWCGRLFLFRGNFRPPVGQDYKGHSGRSRYDAIYVMWSKKKKPIDVVSGCRASQIQPDPGE